jgi:5-methylcytosine-specific restriction endonuclease McrA
MEDTPFDPVSEEALRQERQKAHDLRRTQWWKNRRGDGLCHYCGRRFPPRELTMDHLVPLSRGGRTTRGNVVPCCKECNTRKQHLLPVEWEAYLAGLGRSGS